jgi:hypothetical protein
VHCGRSQAGGVPYECSLKAWVDRLHAAGAKFGCEAGSVKTAWTP